MYCWTMLCVGREEGEGEGGGGGERREGGGRREEGERENDYSTKH